MLPEDAFTDSLILTLEKQREFVRKIMGGPLFQPKPNLIYRATEHGFRPESIFAKIVNNGPTLMIFKTTKKRIFGGFTAVDWES